ncbi:hypothetical protein PR048_029506 [Dryococelus australis]|uniref:Uncharacterized protein n=1 Tax=Dryococelus australis TaxID=614101 RepID=A0ABQ9GDX6_9NEOP|nr:hypothetical protein PR048_029506 [Dryococelus australis]
MALLKAQRVTLLVVANVYRAVSPNALHILYDDIPIVLLISYRKGGSCGLTAGIGHLSMIGVMEHVLRHCASGRKDGMTEKGRLKDEWIEMGHYQAQYATRHGNSKGKHYKFNLTDTPLCQECEIEDTARLVLAVRAKVHDIHTAY